MPSIPEMQVAVTGSTGLIGSALVAALELEGARVRRVVRGAPRPGEIAWDPAAGHIDAAALEGVDAVVHLAGAPIGERWSARKKRRIWTSRVDGTALLAEALAALRARPRVLVSASGVGYYGDRGEERLDETSPAGTGFFPELATAWEAASAPAERAGIRVVRMRTGMVLTPLGGALGRMLLPFRLGVGGRLGSGRQWMSWISLPDMLAVIRFALTSPELHGAINVVAPEPVTNREFTRTLGRVLHRPTPFPVPAAALRLLFGEMADAALLASQRALPRRLLESGFHFRHPQLEDALRAVLRRD